MASYNKVILMGNLTRDPELRYTPKGTPVAAFGLAVNRVFRTETGETRQETTFVDIEAWSQIAERIAKYVKKGSPILVEGRLRLDQWDDKKTGQKRSKLVVVCENFRFVGPAREAEPAELAEQAEPAEPNSLPPPDDDVPF
ncbi:MAG: single-stranded DNA-binding protein [Verrucomicrobiae bacterium]|nr:single-stranded DNA-binding protein [Verrucomicrobiae bacterium]MCX7722961.1 single-stranded DNA-binding protein [Verrucomicrobiae bacterium]MDW7980432.1 single-stranded DNA-binding protein [Verrucomicrobiales bacterium]